MAATVTLTLEPIRRNARLKHPSMPADVPVYQHGDVIKGRFSVALAAGSVSHKGISVALRGVYRDRMGQDCEQFFEKALQILPPSELKAPLSAPFSLGRVSVPFGTYMGGLANVVYFVECRVDAARGAATAVAPLYLLLTSEIVARPLVKAIGIVKIMHIDVMIQSVVIDARKCILGALLLTLVKIRMVSMTLELHRRERISGGLVPVAEKCERIASFEIMDGAPVRGTLVPVRMYIGGLGCWPAPKATSKVRCKYWLRIRG